MVRHFNCKFTEQEEVEIVKQYQSGLNMKDLAQIHSVGRDAIKGALERQGVNIRHGGINACGRLFTPEQDLEAMTMYHSGYSEDKVARHFKVSRSVIVKSLDRQGVKRRARRINFFNEGAFDDLSSELPLYWIGFLYADCDVTDNELRIGLSIKDLSQLEKLRDFMKSEVAIKIKRGSTYQGYTSNDSCHLSFASRGLVSRLRSLGIVARRGKFACLKAHIPDDLAYHFIRGYLDGDGSISTNQQVVFLGQPDLLEWIKEMLHKQAEASLNNKIRQRRGICEISWGGLNQVRRIVDYLYRDATIYLERKRRVADSWK